MRFAEMEYKMTLVRVLREFSIVFGPDSEIEDLTVEQQSFLMHPKNGVQIKLDNDNPNLLIEEQSSVNYYSKSA
uniref:Uncharacterized protein n=1 Tax=Romanomermis culicivorax TaxID=13658 RepID=A0A915KLB2_ROMCU